MSTWAHHSGLKSNALFSAISSENDSMKFAVESFGKDLSQINSVQERSTVHLVGILTEFINDLEDD